MRIRFVPLAKREVLKVSDAYDRCLPGLGDAFLDELTRTLTLIQTHPNAWPIVLDEDARRARLNRFPYGVVFKVVENAVVVFAVAHLKRRPAYWRKRLDKPKT